jgi:hypothetical protein
MAPPPPAPELEGAIDGSKLDGALLLELEVENAKSVGLLLDLVGTTVKSMG